MTDDHASDAEETPTRSTVVDLVPFIFVRDVHRSIDFYELLGFRVIKTHMPAGVLEFAGLETTGAAKIMLARVDSVPPTELGSARPGFIYFYTPDLDAFRAALIERGVEVEKPREGPGPGPNREVCVRDPDGHGHMVVELFEGSVGRDPAASV